ncbi:hypothetical protein TNCV_4473161 [Trichonephila clavipes]|uniref:Uncharacterized protein n=1 Tax=Trichonephila clavipes TaxID=2585209 RepID=A0A8X6VKQ5_TRICX|nr:hypothetical protein TNCV_4473161 [Trichonephila clavipes]
MPNKDIFEFVQSSKNIIDADSDDENEMNYAAHVPTSSEMRNIMKKLAERGPEASLSLPERPDTPLEIIDLPLLMAVAEVEEASSLPERILTSQVTCCEKSSQTDSLNIHFRLLENLRKRSLEG